MEGDEFARKLARRSRRFAWGILDKPPFIAYPKGVRWE